MTKEEERRIRREWFVAWACIHAAGLALLAIAAAARG